MVMLAYSEQYAPIRIMSFRHYLTPKKTSGHNLCQRAHIFALPSKDPQSHFHLHKERVSPNIRARVLINVIIMQCMPHFHSIDKNFSLIQLLVNKKLFHQSSFYLCNFVHQSRGRKSRKKVLDSCLRYVTSERRRLGANITHSASGSRINEKNNSITELETRFMVIQYDSLSEVEARLVQGIII